MGESSDLAAYLVILLVASALADVGEDYDYTYTNLFPKLSNQRSGLDPMDADPDEIHEFLSADYKAVPKLASIRYDDGLLFRSTTLPSTIAWINASGANQRLGQTTVVKKRGGVPWPYATHFNRMETSVIMIPTVNRIRTSTAEQTTSSVTTSNHVFDFRWNDLIKKTTQISQ